VSDGRKKPGEDALRHRIALAAALALGPATAALAQEPQRGGQLVFAVSAEPPTYDCHTGNTFTVLHHVSPHYSTLLRFDPKRPGEVEGDLAESWEVAPDGLAYTFKLRSGVKFHDGSELGAEDVKRATSASSPRRPGSSRSARRRSRSLGDREPDPRTVVFRSPTQCEPATCSTKRKAAPSRSCRRTWVGGEPLRQSRRSPGLANWLTIRLDLLEAEDDGARSGRLDRRDLLERRLALRDDPGAG